MYEFRACAEKKSTDLHSCLDRPDRPLLRGLDSGPYQDKIISCRTFADRKTNEKGNTNIHKKDS